MRETADVEAHTYLAEGKEGSLEVPTGVRLDVILQVLLVVLIKKPQHEYSCLK